MPNNGPIPSYASERLIGLELEYDAKTTKLSLPTTTPSGWSRQSDGSLQNGVEMVLNPPLTLTDATPVVKEFADAFNRARTNTFSSGGFHVHVQVADYTEHDAGNLARLYHHFQTQINRLLGKSRHNNHYCPPFTHSVTDADLSSRFNLGSLASTRASAKSARKYQVVNFAMMRCTRHSDRTVEFRQGSTTKRFECIIGWAAFCVAMVEIAKNDAMTSAYIGQQASWENFVQMLRDHESMVGASHIADWVVWRREYLEETPSDELISKAVAAMGRRPRGIFHISRALDINLPLSERTLNAAVSRGLIAKIGSKYQAKFVSFAGSDLEQLQQAAEAREAAMPADRSGEVLPGEEQ